MDPGRGGFSADDDPGDDPLPAAADAPLLSLTLSDDLSALEGDPPTAVLAAWSDLVGMPDDRRREALSAEVRRALRAEEVGVGIPELMQAARMSSSPSETWGSLSKAYNFNGNKTYLFVTEITFQNPN